MRSSGFKRYIPLASPALLFLLSLLLLLSCGQAPPRWIAFVPEGEGYRRVELEEAPALAPTPTLLEADLDADGRPELVRWEGSAVRVERDGEMVWQSEPNWRVIDVVAGDIWNDLRREILLAMWKEDEQGTPRSHPFIMGHRRGYYDLLWGGSAVNEPIRELELGDVDGDGRNELIVLEGAYGDPEEAAGRAISVWRWNGWGFTLLWRSEPGQYRGLVLLDVDGDGKKGIVVQEE